MSRTENVVYIQHYQRPLVTLDVTLHTLKGPSRETLRFVDKMSAARALLQWDAMGLEPVVHSFAAA